MEIRTSRGRTISVDFAYAPTTSGSMVVKMADGGQTFSEICDAFEGVDRFEYIDKTNDKAPVLMFGGYTRFHRLSRENGAIMIALRKEG